LSSPVCQTCLIDLYRKMTEQFRPELFDDSDYVWTQHKWISSCTFEFEKNNKQSLKIDPGTQKNHGNAKCNKTITALHLCNMMCYHIVCCNMFVFACPIIVRSQCWLFSLRIGPQTSVLALKYPYLPPNLTSGICNLVAKKICQSTRKDGKFVFQSN
jgi:hypothetical protein